MGPCNLHAFPLFPVLSYSPPYPGLQIRAKGLWSELRQDSQVLQGHGIDIRAGEGGDGAGLQEEGTVCHRYSVRFFIMYYIGETGFGSIHPRPVQVWPNVSDQPDRDNLQVVCLQVHGGPYLSMLSCTKTTWFQTARVHAIGRRLRGHGSGEEQDRLLHVRLQGWHVQQGGEPHQLPWVLVWREDFQSERDKKLLVLEKEKEYVHWGNEWGWGLHLWGLLSRKGGKGQDAKCHRTSSFSWAIYEHCQTYWWENINLRFILHVHMSFKSS